MNEDGGLESVKGLEGGPKQDASRCRKREIYWVTKREQPRAHQQRRKNTKYTPGQGKNPNKAR